MKLNRRDFFASSTSLLFLLGETLSAESNNFSDLNDSEKKEVLFEIVKEMDGKYTFPIPIDSEDSEKERKQAEKKKELALSVNKSLFEFGAGRPYDQKHKGIDIYMVALAKILFILLMVRLMN